MPRQTRRYKLSAMSHARRAVALLFALLAMTYAAGVPKSAPDFTLESASGQPFSLAAQRGHKVVISFYRGFY